MEIATKVYLLQNLKKQIIFKIENTHETMNVFKIRAILNTIDSISAVSL
jgi:threonine dehydratase